MKPTNVTRLLDARNIQYMSFGLPEEKLGAVEAAEFLGVPPAQVYKTIVITREGKGKPILAVIPGDREVDLKLLAKAAGEKKVYLPTERDAERLTGLRAGGISPLALINRGFQVFIDAAAEGHAEIFISGGQRGLDIRLSPTDLAGLVNAKYALISR